MIHKTRTKALSWLLSLALVLSLMPGMSLTAYASPSTGDDGVIGTGETVIGGDTYPLWVGGTQVTSANASDTFNDGKASYNAETNTLTLNGYSYTGVGHKENNDPDSPLAAIYYTGTDPLTIQLSGTSSITRTGNSSGPGADTAYGIHCSQGNLTIDGNGSGSLTVTGGELKTAYGIVATTVTIKNANVTSMGKGSSYGTGIYGKQGISIQNATVTAEGKGYGISGDTGSAEIEESSSVTALGSIKAISGTVKNSIAGTGWTDTAGTEGEAAIAVSTEGQDLSAYKKVQFPAALDPVASVTPYNGTATEYTDFAEAVTAWNDASNGNGYASYGATLTLLTDVETNSSVRPNVKCLSDYPMILDLNGYGIRYTGTTGSVIYVDENMGLKMKDSNPSRVHYINLDSNGRGIAVSDTTSEGAIEVTGGYITGGNGGSSYGGGVHDMCSFVMEGGTIVGNTSNYGAGVLISQSGSTFTMTGGTITGNKASDEGGGVRFGSTCVFNLSGGTITGNSAGTNGGGVYVFGGATFKLSGGAVIKDNLKGTDKDNVYLSSGRKITITDALTNSDPIGVTMQTPGVFTEGGKAKDYAAKFTSDDTAYSVVVDGNELKLSQPAVSYQAASWDSENNQVTYTTESCTSYTVVTKSTTTWEDGKWYVVKDNVSINPYGNYRITVSGTANLILCDGATLTAPLGITVADGSTLNIYAQSEGTGKLYIKNNDGGTNAAIGGLYNSSGVGGAGGTVNIHGGEITAQFIGGTGAGIGGGAGSTTGGSGGTVTIYGGKVTTAGGSSGAGIGGGNGLSTGGAGGTVTIYGGEVTAVGSTGAGIGGGAGSAGGAGGTVAIYGGTVKTEAGGNLGHESSVGIGGGYRSGGGRGTDGTLTLGTGMHLYGGTSANPETDLSKHVAQNNGDYARSRYMTVNNVAPHTHNFTYSVGTGSGADTITATCGADGCPLPLSSEGGTDHVATLTIVAPTLTTYGGTGDATATLTGLDDFKTATGKAIATTEIKYVGRDGTSYDESTTAPTNAGKYTAKITVEEQTAQVNYEIAKVNQSVTAPTAKTNLIYDGTSQGLLNSSAMVTHGNYEGVRYQLNGGDWTDSTPYATNAGTYTVNYKVLGNENYNEDTGEPVTVTIAKANQEITSPTGQENLKYTGYEQNLLNTRPVVIKGIKPSIAQFKIGNDGEWSTSLPTGTAVGAYTVYYKIEGNDNYNEYNGSISVSIAKAANPATVTGTASVTKGSKTIDLASNVTKNGATGTVSYAIDGEANGCTLDGSVLTSGANAGTVTVNVSIAADTNYEALAATPITVTITDKAEQTITASDVTATYGDTDKSVSASVTTPATGGGAISYAVKSGSEDYIEVNASTGALTIKKAGTATVTVTAAETNDYAAATKEVTVTISKANPSYTVPTGLTATYGQTLADVTLPNADNGAWSWNDATTASVGNAGSNTFKATFTPTNTDNYNTISDVDVTVTVGQAQQTAPVLKVLTRPDTPYANGSIGNNEASVSTERLQVSTDGGKTWADVTVLPYAAKPGTYQFKYKDEDNHAASEIVKLLVEPVNELREVKITSDKTDANLYKDGETNTLTAKTNTNVTGLALEFAWYREGVTEAVGTGATYTLQAADVGKKLTVVVTDKTTGATEPYTSVSTATPVIVTVAPTTYQITGNVKVPKTDGGSEYNNVANATVELRQGNTVFATATTNDDGNYTFSSVPNGEYNIVVTDANGTTKTEYVKVENGNQTIDVTMPFYKVSSKVDVKGETPAAVVAGLDDAAANSLTTDEKASGVTTTMTMEIESTNDLTETPDTQLSEEQEQEKIGQQAIKDQNTGANKSDALDFIDMSVYKRTQKDGESAQVEGVHNLTKVLEILLPYTTANRSFNIFRYHDTAAAKFTQLSTRPTGSFTDGQFFVGDGFIAIYASGFSTYAIGYSDATSPTPTPTPSYPSSGGNGGYTATLTVPVSGDSASVSVSASVSGSTATVKAPTTAQLDKVIGESVKTGEVTIDVSGLNRNIATVSILTETVKAIEKAVNDPDNDASALTVKLTDGSVTFDAKALAAITDQAKGGTIQLNLDGITESGLRTAQKTAIKDMDVQAIYDAYLTSNGQRISDFKGGKATVTVSYTLKDGQIGRGVVVWYVADDGKTAEVPTAYNDKTVSFTVEHFSNYVIAYDAERAAACPQDSTCPISAFTDADPTAWYHDGVHYVLENGIMSGLGNGQFAPNDTTSRAMLAQILYNMEGKPAIRSGIPFEDVSESDWYAMAISWAESNGIIGGYGNGKFGPNDDLTREQLVTIMYRYAKDKGIDVSVGENTNILSYDDAFDVSEWAIPAMQWAVGNGLISGKTASTLNPKDKATRAEIATIIMRYCEEIAK